MHELTQINPTTFPSIFPPARFGTITSVTNLIIPLVFTLSAVMFLGMLIAGAYKVITAGGNPENMTQAKNLFKYAMLGMILILAAYLIVKLISYIAQIRFIL